MTKKNKNKNNNKKRINNKKQKNKNKDTNMKPFVSICTPTFNRRPFIESTIKCYLHQDYPKDLMEWIIIDDGTDHIEDLVKDISGVKYFKYNEKMTLGKKRNLMHEKSKGDIIVYMDDDDYYPPERVSHAVEKLIKNKNALCAGSSEIYVWFKHIQKMVQFGPYSPKHATAGTFAFKRELLKQTSYDDNASLAEEKHFLKNYSIPFTQLEPLKTILVFSHNHNTFDKKKLLNNIDGKFTRYSGKKVDDFIKQEDLRLFYMEKIENLLENYEPGLPKYKPDVIKQTKQLEEERKQNNNNKMIMIKKNDGSVEKINLEQLINTFNNQNNVIKQYKDATQNMKIELDKRSNNINQLIHKINEQQQEINILKSRLSQNTV